MSNCAGQLLAGLFVLAIIFFAGFTISLHEEYAHGHRTHKETVILTIVFILVIIGLIAGIWAVIP